jgi:hypothetical protein
MSVTKTSGFKLANLAAALPRAELRPLNSTFAFFAGLRQISHCGIKLSRHQSCKTRHVAYLNRCTCRYFRKKGKSRAKSVFNMDLCELGAEPSDGSWPRESSLRSYASATHNLCSTRRQRLSHPSVRSTIQRFGRTVKPLATEDRGTISRYTGRWMRNPLTQSTSGPVYA